MHFHGNINEDTIIGVVPSLSSLYWVRKSEHASDCERSRTRFPQFAYHFRDHEGSLSLYNALFFLWNRLWKTRMKNKYKLWSNLAILVVSFTGMVDINFAFFCQKFTNARHREHDLFHGAVMSNDLQNKHCVETLFSDVASGKLGKSPEALH